jgi:hypothetical protein
MAMKVSKGGKALVARIEKAATLAFFGADLVRIAENMEVSYETIRDWKKYEEWDATLEQLRDTQRQAATTKIDALTIRAIDGLENSLQSSNEGIRLRASIWWLERGKGTLQADSDVTLMNGPCRISYDSDGEPDESPQVMIARFRQARLSAFQFVYRRNPVDEEDMYGGLKALQATLEKAPAPTWGKSKESVGENAA